MIRPWTVTIALGIALAGCASLEDKDRYFLQSYGISGPLYKHMAHRRPLTLDEIIELSREGVPDAYITHYLRSTHSHYSVNEADVARLRAEGVSNRVILCVQAPPEKGSHRRESWWNQNSTT